MKKQNKKRGSRSAEEKSERGLSLPVAIAGFVKTSSALLLFRPTNAIPSQHQRRGHARSHALARARERTRAASRGKGASTVSSFSRPPPTTTTAKSSLETRFFSPARTKLRFLFGWFPPFLLLRRSRSNCSCLPCFEPDPQRARNTKEGPSVCPKPLSRSRDRSLAAKQKKIAPARRREEN